MKTRVAVLFGGRSVEHEVSVISGIQAYMNMDKTIYDATPVYITKSGEMYIGQDVGSIEAYKDINGLISRSERVIFVNEGGRVYLTPYPPRRFKKQEKTEVDVALPVVHGTNAEDGSLQGYLRTVGLPFAGCEVTASAVGMDKHLTKVILRDAGIPVLDCLTFTTADYADVDTIVSACEERLGYPVIVKPVNLGSSVGIGVAKDATELERCIDDAFLYAPKVLIEHAISNLREINCSVLGDEDAAQASVCEEPLHTEEILSYKDKYMSGGGAKGTKGGVKSGGAKGGSAGMASLQRKIPADLSDEEAARVQDLSVRAFKALGCSGVVRIDYMIDGDTGELYFNEINTLPGSLAFYLWEATGVPYAELLDRLVKIALKRARRDEGLTFTFDTNILAQASLGGGAKGGAKQA